MWQFSKMTNSELVSWFIMFLNGGNWNDPEDCKDYEEACKEAAKRGAEVQEEIAYLKEVI